VRPRHVAPIGGDRFSYSRIVPRWRRQWNRPADRAHGETSWSCDIRCRERRWLEAFALAACELLHPTRRKINAVAARSIHPFEVQRGVQPASAAFAQWRWRETVDCMPARGEATLDLNPSEDHARRKDRARLRSERRILAPIGGSGRRGIPIYDRNRRLVRHERGRSAMRSDLPDVSAPAGMHLEKPA
jgi:hypothetical protein